MRFENPRSDDEVLHHKGRAVLAVPDEIADELSGLTLDINPSGQLVLS